MQHAVRLPFGHRPRQRCAGGVRPGGFFMLLPRRIALVDGDGLRLHHRRRRRHISPDEPRREERAPPRPLAHGTLPRSGRVANTPRRSGPHRPQYMQTLVRTHGTPANRAPSHPCTPFGLQPAMRGRRPPRRLLHASSQADRPSSTVTDSVSITVGARRRHISPDEPRRSQAVEAEAWATRFVRAEVAR